MTLTKSLIASAVALCALQAQASITMSSSSVVPIGPVSFGFDVGEAAPASISFVGGHIFADGDSGVGSITAKPPGATGGWWSVGPDAPQSSTGIISFAGGATEVSFLWGSPDDYNVLEINGTAFNKTLLGTSLTGDRDIGVYLTIKADQGDFINSLTFRSNSNAFEVDNLRVATVPEPGTYALLLSGMGVMGFVAKRRKAG
jgi:hypothetical protein